MTPQQGWRPTPSPRRGFTLVGALREESAPPVVVAVTESPHALRLFRTAIDEAIGRSLDLIVLDLGNKPLSDRMRSGSSDDREAATLRSLWSNRHVRVVRPEPIDPDLSRVLEFCETEKAVLLVLGADQIATSLVDLDRIFSSNFDVLVVTAHGSQARTPVL